MEERKSVIPNGTTTSTTEIRDNFNDMAERTAYSLHFHSVSHYLSADWYANCDRWLTYVVILLSAICTMNAGSFFNCYIQSEQVPFHIFNLISAVCSVVLSSIVILNSSEYAPRNQKAQHAKAGSKLKQLEQKVDVWGRTTAMNPDQSTENLRKEYNMFLGEMSTLKEDQVKSEDWTFPTVHKQLGKKWKAVKERDEAKKTE